MVWTSIIFDYRIDFHIFDRGCMTAVQCRDKILEPDVGLFTVVVGIDFIFTDDTSHLHRAHLLAKFLECENIYRMKWIIRFRGLNQKRHIWSVLEKRISIYVSLTVTSWVLQIA
ncbi:transposable element Tcb2 transposase [Trichonephila clavipes]|nr:transposable element Tcb2 transposase [Trichonephila clavipes]